MGDPSGINLAQRNKRSRLRLRIWVRELALTGLVLLLLSLLAGPLSEGHRAQGLDQRYVVPQDTAEVNAGTYRPDAGPPALGFHAPAITGKPLRAQWLNEHAGAMLTTLALCGLLTLNLGRSISRSSVKQPLIAACWCLTGYVSGTFDARWSWTWLPQYLAQFIASGNAWLCAAVVLLMIALACALSSRHKALSDWEFTHAAASVWVYPGLVLFCGTGWLWLLDWAARGHLDKQFVGIYQIDALWLAFALFTLIAAQQGQILAGISRAVSRLEQISVTRMGWLNTPDLLLLAGLLAWTGLIVLLGHFGAGSLGHLKMYQRQSALLAELMRIPVWLALGWIVYRWVETGHSKTARRRGLSAVVVLLSGLVCGLKLDHDGGPILAQTIAVVWISSGLLLAVLLRRFRSKSGWIAGWLAATGSAVAGTAGAIWLAFIQAPGKRVDAMRLDFQGPLDFLSVMHWLMDATPAFGFGLGKTPWCGYAHAAGLVTQCRRAGVPGQIQSDYVAFAMLSLWGWLPTLLILAALLLWLWELLRKVPARQGQTCSFDLLRHWTVTGFAVTSAVQIALSVAGTLGRTPLAGLAIPMLSLGGAGLVSTAIFAGLSVNRMQFRRRAQPAATAGPGEAGQRLRDGRSTA